MNNLLLYLETRCVDYAGRVDTIRMNQEELNQCDKWKNEGFIEWGRIKFKDLNKQGGYWVKLSEKAWEEAHKIRRMRAEKQWKNKEFDIVGESE